MAKNNAVNKENQIQYMAKITNALNSIFDKDSENYIDIEKVNKDGNLNDFFHVLGTRAPQFVFARITGQEPDPLEFNHICNRLIFQDKQK